MVNLAQKLKRMNYEKNLNRNVFIFRFVNESKIYD